MENFKKRDVAKQKVAVWLAYFENERGRALREYHAEEAHKKATRTRRNQLDYEYNRARENRYNNQGE